MIFLFPFVVSWFLTEISLSFIRSTSRRPETWARPSDSPNFPTCRLLSSLRLTGNLLKDCWKSAGTRFVWLCSCLLVVLCLTHFCTSIKSVQNNLEWVLQWNKANVESLSFSQLSSVCTLSFQLWIILKYMLFILKWQILWCQTSLLSWQIKILFKTN